MDGANRAESGAEQAEEQAGQNLGPSRWREASEGRFTDELGNQFVKHRLSSIAHVC